MKRIANLLKKDILLGIKDIFILLEVMFAIVGAAVLVFIIPENIDSESTVYIWDKTTILKDFVREFAQDETDESGEIFVASRQAVVEGMEENRSAVGIIIDESTSGEYAVELLTQPYTTQAVIDYVGVEMEDLLAVLTDSAGAYPPQIYETVKIVALAEGRRDEIPFNQRLVPPVLLMMVGVIGLFAMVSLLGQERSDKTIRAVRVTPTGLTTVLLSKHLTLLITGFVTFSIIYLSTIGTGGYLPSLLIMVLTIVIGSSLGVMIGTFFDNPMSAIGWVFLLVLVFGLPAVSLFSPVFSPLWIRFIPSYHTLFALDAAMFPADNAGVIGGGATALAAFAAVLIPLSGWIYVSHTRKEA